MAIVLQSSLHRVLLGLGLIILLLLQGSYGFSTKNNLIKAKAPHKWLEEPSSSLFYTLPRDLPHQVHSTCDPSIRSKRKQRFWTMIRRSMAALCLLMTLTFGGPAFAVSGGRMGGSFPRTTSSGRSSSYTRSSGYNTRNYQYYPTSYDTIGRPSAMIHQGNSRFTISATDLIIVGGVACIIYNTISSKQKTTLLSLTTCVAIPDSTAPDSLVNRLNILSNSVDTTTRNGVQDLISNVALELLRQEPSLISAVSSSMVYHSDDLAQRAFYEISTKERAKFVKETIHKFGTTTTPTITTGATVNLLHDSVSALPDDPHAKPTFAVVTLTLLLVGAALVSWPSVTSRSEWKDTLQTLSATVAVDNALLAGEVLWAPTGINEQLAQEQIFADYPNLFPM